ncbi:SPOR domain-containing protein [Jeongeupia chitinilytica]|uniref:SPOR domain-containing protein n=1 Tax=Jeongeupia chitinilytica TaxID=1041641 RepID=A0ABQ3GZG2_9NEIS|nr:SPOR domain-containing protein [Jeongeupia chitinilytica]GHD62888.1 hypothetical protein GCM10007350_19270 [Jeongeupia chitinilytica]
MSDTPERDADSGTTPDPIDEQRSQQKLHTQLYWRLGIAVVLIGLVIGTLQLLDRSKQAPPAPQIASPSPIASAPTADTASASAPAAEAASSAASASQPEAEAEHPQAPTTAMPPQQHDTSPQSTTESTTSRAIKPAREIPAPTTAPAPAKTVAPSVGATSPAVVRRADGYTVQAGVFLHSDNAEKLLRKLQAAGVPAYLETRVQIGPFKSRAEADAAAQKLRQLGITPVIAPALNQD